MKNQENAAAPQDLPDELAPLRTLPDSDLSRALPTPVVEAWGHNRSLSVAQVNRAVLERVQSLASEAHKQDVPADIVDFIANANVLFLDRDGRAINFHRVIVAWEEK